jgi:uncharacterized membrane protein YkvA (DUF1232 family)
VAVTIGELKVSFKLSAGDLARLAGVLRAASVTGTERSEPDVIESAAALVEQVRSTAAPSYIVERVQQLDLLLAMLKDTGWPMPESERRKVLAAVAYFADPRDLIPDHIPGLGFLDDAIMIELAIRELRLEIDGYREFCRYRHRQWEVPWHRQSAGSRDRNIARRRERIRARIDRRLASREGDR